MNNSEKKPIYKPSLNLLPVIAALALSAVVAFVALETWQLSLERNFKDEMAIEGKARAIDILAQTMNGNVMGAVISMGLVDRSLKNDALGKEPPNNPLVMEPLRANGQVHQTTGMYVVNTSGVIQSCYHTVGKLLTGVDVKFRPYFKIAMQGKQNVYAAIGTTTGEPTIYFAAPLYEQVSATSPVIGAVVARLSIDRVISALKEWRNGPALLMSPQQIAFSSSREDWVAHIAKEPGPEQLQAIRDLKQFGHTFETGVPKVLPFDISKEVVMIDNRRYAIARAPIQWNDPQGEWTLILLGDLDRLTPVAMRIKTGFAAGAVTLMLSGFFIVWRTRLRIANLKRQQAEVELAAYTRRLELDSSIKSELGKITAELHQATSVDEFARKFLFHASIQVGFEYGAFYFFEPESNLLAPVAGHGVLVRHLETFAVGQGLVGQCAKDRSPIVISEMISDSTATKIRIIWGGGEIVPNLIMFQPVCHRDHLLGVIVFACLQPVDTSRRAMLEAMLPMVATNLAILQRNVSLALQAETLKQQQTRLQETEDLVQTAR